MHDDALQLVLGEVLARVPPFLDEGREGATLAVLVLDPDPALLNPAAVVPDDVLVLGQSRQREHLIHGRLLLSATEQLFLRAL